ncbi:tRNA (adenosine(37)-N6)-threonylcarbamoyltransferase complex ATPase subunit type 1 TsaE [bacterium]|nr:tRNA (adenosine(37)-N6)-threonylcarbamoyltransferase complex ATPase subunit type 1 TsaE [bacterium]
MNNLAKRIAAKLSPGSILTLEGDLGAGKTTFTSFLVSHLGIGEIVTSPTFTYLNIYDDSVAHFDLYRLNSLDEFFALGFEEYLGAPFITIIEWPKIVEKACKDPIHITLTHKGDKREVAIHGILL